MTENLKEQWKLQCKSEKEQISDTLEGNCMTLIEKQKIKIDSEIKSNAKKLTDLMNITCDKKMSDFKQSYLTKYNADLT